MSEEPDLAVKEAVNKGYDYWAISEVVIEEGWPLLDYLLVLELIRHCQQHLHEHYTLGHAFIRGTLQQLNKHRKENEKSRDNEFQIFFEHYKELFFRFGRHRFYHNEILEQYRNLAGDGAAIFKENLRGQVDVLRELIPENAPRQSFDPQRMRARLHQFEELYAHDPDHPGLLPLLAGVFLRLDRSDNYGELVRAAKSMAEAAQPVCEEIVEQIGDRDAQRDTIRNTALRLLREWEVERRPSAVDEVEKEWEREDLLTSFYNKLLGLSIVEPWPRDQALYWYMRDGKSSEADIRRALERPGVRIPDGNRAIITSLFKGRMAGEQVHVGRRVRG